MSVVAAKEFCRALENEAALPRRDLIHRLLTAILARYGAGLALPEVDPDTDGREEPFLRSWQGWPAGDAAETPEPRGKGLS